jgi:hypothetical protein
VVGQEEALLQRQHALQWRRLAIERMDEVQHGLHRALEP